MMVDRVFQLTGTCNNYKWGKKGRDSLAAQLHAKTDPNFQIKDDERYSELWFGDYPKSPARVLKTGELLKDVLDKNPEILLGKKVIEELGAQLPYLPKILSIDKALQLQIHPNKALAAKLHAHDPAQFTDPNHKPEIAIVLDRFETFAGFKPLASIQPLFLCLPVLGHFVPAGANPHAWTDDTLREVVRALLKADDRLVQTVQEALLATPREKLGEAGYILDLLPRLQEQHGATDAGSLVALLLMNFLDLGPGEAVFIPADGIHAYLSGNIVECMARSDNVLCLGFCPRGERDDVDLFADTVRFEGAHSVGDVYLPGVKTSKSKGGKAVVYSPPIGEFDVLRAVLRAGEGDVIAPSEGPGVMIVTRGRGRMRADGEVVGLEEGGIWFVAPGVEVEWETEDAGGLELHMAFV